MPLTLPAFGVEQIAFHPQNPSRGGGVATNGQEQTVSSGAGRWEATVTGTLLDNDQIMAWRAFLWAMEGRANTVLVPVFDRARAPWPMDQYGRTLSPLVTRHYILDGTIYADPAILTESEILAAVNVNAGLRAALIAINVSQGSTLRAGHYFGLGGNRLYGIKEIVSTAGSVQTVRVFPPLRAAATAGDAVELVNPVCEMKLASDDEGKLALTNLARGQVSINLVEAL